MAKPHVESLQIRWTFMTDKGCHRKMRVAVRNNSSKPSCWTIYRQLLQEHRSNDPVSIIQSDEYFTRECNDRNIVDWGIVKDTLHDWNFVILVTYRRLVDWYTSAREQFRVRTFRRWQAPIPPTFPHALAYAMMYSWSTTNRIA